MKRLSREKPTLVKKRSTDMDLEQLDSLTKFFAGPCNQFVHKTAHIIIIVMTLLGIVMFANAVRMAPLSSQEEILPEGHPVLILKDLMTEQFTETVNSQETLNVVIHWGIEGLDRSKVGAWDAASSGKLIWDENFTILPAANQ